MTAAAGETVSIRVVVEDAGSLPVQRVREQFAALGTTATEAATQVTTALGRADVALNGTTERAAAVGAAMAGAAVQSVTASQELGAAATLAGLRATEAMTRYAVALAEVEAGASAAAAGVARFGAEATIAAGQAKAALAAYAAATKEVAAVAGVHGAEAGASFGRKFGEGAMETARKALGPIIAMFAAFKAVEFFGDSVHEGMEEKTAIRRVKQQFGEASQEVLEFGEHANAAFLLTAKGADTLAANFGNFLHSFGIVGPAAAEMSMKLTGLAADMAKYHGDSDTDRVEKALDAALKGRPILLKQYGVAINDTTIAEAARTHGIGNGITALTAQQRAEAIYLSLLDQTVEQQGAVARSAGTLGYEKKRLANEMENLQAQIGLALVPMLATLASILADSIVPVLKLVFETIKPILDALSSMPHGVQVAIAAVGLFSVVLTRMTTRVRAASAELGAGVSRMAAFGSAAGALATKLATGLGIGIFITAISAAFSAMQEQEEQLKKTTDDLAESVNSLTDKLLANGNVLTDQMKAQQVQAALNSDEFKALIAMGYDYNTMLDVIAGRSTPDQLKALRQQEIRDPLAKNDIEWAIGMGHSGEDAQAEAAKKIAWDKLHPDLAVTPEAAEGAAAGGEAAADAEAANNQINELTGATDVLTDAAVQAQAALKIKDNVKTSWNDLDNTVGAVIKKLDVMAGRNPTAEQAQEDLDKVATSFKDTFKLGQAGQVHMDPKKVLNADGTINTNTVAGQNLRDSTIDREQALTKAAQTASDAVVQKGGTVEQGKAAAEKVLEDGYRKFIDQNAVLLGSKDAAEQLAKTYGIVPDRIVTEVTANTETAKEHLKEIIHLQDIVAAGTTAGTPIGEDGEPGGPPEASTTPPHVDSTAGTFDSDSYRNSSDAGAAGKVHAPDATAYAPLGRLAGRVGSAIGGAIGGVTLPAGTPLQSGTPDPALVAAASPGYPTAVTQWAPQIAQADAIVGLPQTLQSWKDAFYRINKESTGNPQAVNDWDPNAQAGHPSKGLVQVIDTTFADYHAPGHANIFDPVDNLVAGMNWSKHTYGSVHAGFSRPGGYDQGGWLPPGGIAVSNLRVPEAILNPSQWETARAAMQRPAGGVTVHEGAFQIHVSGGGTGDTDLAELRRSIARIFKEEAERRR